MSAPDPQPVIPIRLDYAGPDTVRPLLTILQRTLLAIAALLPLIGFFLAGVFMGIFAWQSGKPAEMVGMLYHPGGAWPFYILSLYAIICTGRIVIRPAAIARPFVRTGVFSGLAVGIQYVLVFAALLTIQSDQSSTRGDGWLFLWASLCAWAGLIGLGIVVYRIGSKVGVNPAKSCLNGWAWGGLGLGGAGLSLIWLFESRRRFGTAVGALFFAGLHAWPLLAYAGMAALARRMAIETLESAAGRPIILTKFFAAYGSAWGASLVSSVVTYSYLPTQQPRLCYVATAAAQGHRRLVRSRSTRGGCAVNDQMCYLRAAELVLHCVWPWGQRAIRWAYDHVGPRLASFIVHPLLADAAYLLLKPFEWAARVFLRVMVTDPAALAARLYPTDERPTSAWT